ncbi:Rv3235 family protein [Streptomyces cinnabarinus]|uniref:Rv3235 family protein n=1 Tax=Streptomyces cinnabarinus TaxID=67287 RepID=A0ABY7KGT9_9ACTN|nr:Rv3235 family protein [Streptomyces cinnabarinus]WAZ22129.1 Rv3235 family protein [Streptomyces cinnabarinus]
MNKVMTRAKTAKTHPGARPPGRRDTRRPGGIPPRAPSGGRPRDNRPPTAGGPAHASGPACSAGPAYAADPEAATRRAATLEAPLVPPQTPRRPVPPAVPQPRPTDVFADRLLAVLSGQRPVHYMLRHTAGRAYDDLAWLAERGPLRAHHNTRPVVRDIGYYVPSPGAIEVFARIGAGDRLRAMAFRLEQGADLRWRCTAVELGGPARPRANDD